MGNHNNESYYSFFNYFLALSNILDDFYPSYDHLAKKIVKLNGYGKITRKPNVQIDYDEIGKMIRHAWFTETLLVNEVTGDNILRFCLPWSYTKLYYCFHAIGKVYLILSKGPIENRHNSFLNEVSNDVFSIKNRFPEPWNYYAVGNELSHTLEVKNFPDCNKKIKTGLISPRKENQFPLLYLFIRTTRKHFQNELLIKNKKELKKQRLSKEEKIKIFDGLKVTTIFNCFYRMRIRSNYKNVDAFLENNSNDIEYYKFHKNIINVLQKTLFLFELFIAKMIGVKRYGEIVKSFRFKGKFDCEQFEHEVRFSAISNAINGWIDDIPF